MVKTLDKNPEISQGNNKLFHAYLLTPPGVTNKSKPSVEFLTRKVAGYEALRRRIEGKAEIKIQPLKSGDVLGIFSNAPDSTRTVRLQTVNVDGNTRSLRHHPSSQLLQGRVIKMFQGTMIAVVGTGKVRPPLSVELEKNNRMLGHDLPKARIARHDLTGVLNMAKIRTATKRAVSTHHAKQCKADIIVVATPTPAAVAHKYRHFIPDWRLCDHLRTYEMRMSRRTIRVQRNACAYHCSNGTQKGMKVGLPYWPPCEPVRQATKSIGAHRFALRPL